MGVTIRKEAFETPRLGYRPQWPEVAFTSLSANLLSLALPLLTLQVYDRIIVNPHAGTLNILCLGVVVAIIAEAVLRLCRAHGMAWAGAVFEHTVACNTVRQTLGQDVGLSERKGIGAHLLRIGAISKIRDFYSGQVLSNLIDLPFVLVFLCLIAFFGGSLVVVPLVILLVTGILVWSLGRKLKVSLRARNEADDSRYAFLISALGGTHTAKAFGLENMLERRYEASQQKSTLANYHVISLGARTFDQGVFSSHLMMIAVGVFGAQHIMDGKITTGTLVACILLSGRIMQPVQRSMALWARLQDVELACDKVNAHFSQPLMFNHESGVQVANRGDLEIKDLCFSYPNDDPVLWKLNLKLRRGETIAISGENGAGKRTLMKLIAGGIAPTGGEILVNGVSPHILPSEILLDQVGYLPPVGMIFSGTIYENLSRFGCIPHDRVIEMAGLLAIDRDVSALPGGFDTQLDGSYSDGISPGLRQRIAIARVLAAKPRLVLFDNADQALDKGGYNQLYRLLGRLKGRATLVLVSNDRNIRQLADKSYVLEEGQLLEVMHGGAGDAQNMQYRELRI